MVSGVCATVSGTTTPLRAATIASRRRGHRARIGICPFPEQGLPVFAIRGRHPEVDIWAGDEWRMTCTCPLSPSQTLQAQAGALGDGRLGAGRKLAVSGAALLPPMRPLVSGLRSLSELTKSASPLTQVGRRLAACSSRTALLAPPPPDAHFGLRSNEICARHIRHQALVWWTIQSWNEAAAAAGLWRLVGPPLSPSPDGRTSGLARPVRWLPTVACDGCRGRTASACWSHLPLSRGPQVTYESANHPALRSSRTGARKCPT